ILAQGVSPGFGQRQNQALKGRHRRVSPFQGLAFSDSETQGLRPGLTHTAPLGLIPIGMPVLPMTYDEALAFWYDRIDFERRAAQPGDLKLDRMRALLARLGDPQDAF